MITEQEKIRSEVEQILRQLFAAYEDKGILALYLWGSITRQDFDPEVSDIDSLAIIDKRMNPDQRKDIKAWLADKFSHEMKFGLQFIGIEELNGEEPYTLLARYQTPAYLLLRFDEWDHIAGKYYKREDFSVGDMTPAEAMRHQMEQVSNTLQIIDGMKQPDPQRAEEVSLSEDVVKGAMGALYWKTIVSGAEWQIDYNELPKMVDHKYRSLAESLLTIRKRSAWKFDAISAIRPQLNMILSEP